MTSHAFPLIPNEELHTELQVCLCFIPENVSVCLFVRATCAVCLKAVQRVRHVQPRSKLSPPNLQRATSLSAALTDPIPPGRGRTVQLHLLLLFFSLFICCCNTTYTPHPLPSIQRLSISLHLLMLSDPLCPYSSPFAQSRVPAGSLQATG